MSTDITARLIHRGPRLYATTDNGMSMSGVGIVENDADAQRIAACWNACRGVPYNALSLGVMPVSEIARRVGAALDMLEAFQRKDASQEQINKAINLLKGV